MSHRDMASWDTTAAALVPDLDKFSDTDSSATLCQDSLLQMMNSGLKITYIQWSSEERNLMKASKTKNIFLSLLSQ